MWITPMPYLDILEWESMPITKRYDSSQHLNMDDKLWSSRCDLEEFVFPAMIWRQKHNDLSRACCGPR